VDEAAQALSVTFAMRRAGEQGELNIAAGFVPGAECAGGDVFADALLGAAEKGEFPIVNRACAIGRQVCDPTAFDEGIHDALNAVFDEVRAVHQDHAGIAFARRRNQPLD
jgi:hypothetical protein